jgi:cytochrome c oxidase subunit 2
MFFLVIRGLIGWNEVMADIEPGEDYIEIEATGSQFLWYLRYPGNDGALGARDFHLINGINPLGQDWEDPKNLDDLHPTDLVLPVNKKVRVRITSRDVLHNFYLPHFRVKMDAVPGIPTYFIFTPKVTTEEYRENLRKNGKYDFPYDSENPDSNPYWKEFNYELACAELCGASHFSMKKIVKIVTQEEYDEWLTTQQPYYLSTVRGTDEDPYRDQLLDIEIKERREEFTASVESALAATDVSDKVVRLKYVEFETSSSQLTANCKYQLSTLINIMNQYPNMIIDLLGHTDNTGDFDANMVLSQERADGVASYLAERGIEESRMNSQGFGQTRPVDSNDTESGRQNNRRTEIRINN